MQSEIQEVELSIEQAKALVERRDWALKLASNREFKKLILDGYFKDEASRLTLCLADPNMADYKDQVITSLHSISSLKLWLQHIVAMGNVAENEIIENEAHLDELLENSEESA